MGVFFERISKMEENEKKIGCMRLALHFRTYGSAFIMIIQSRGSSHSRVKDLHLCLGMLRYIQSR